MENKYKCQVNWSEETGFLLNTYSDDPQEAISLFKTLKEEVGLADVSQASSKETQDKIKTPVCPKCGSDMTMRHKKSDGSPFWGCNDFPNCKGVVNI